MATSEIQPHLRPSDELGEVAKRKIEEEKAKRKIEVQIYQACIKNKWTNVMHLYRENKFVHESPLYGDTALHIAISYYHPDRDDSLYHPHLTCIIQMIASIPKENRQRILAQKNKKGYTPLHLAAEIGTVPIIECLVNSKEPKLIWEINSKGETPLFVAANHGNLQAFLYLHTCCQNEKREGPIEISRRNDGETILHAAISGQYFELAFQIIHYYEPLVNRYNIEGMSPLHVLSRMPQVFIRESYFRFINRIIYYFIYIEELKPITYHRHGRKEDFYRKYNWNNYLPENYKTLVEFLVPLWKKTPKIHDYIKRTCGGNQEDKSKDTAGVTNVNQETKPQGNQIELQNDPENPPTKDTTNENQEKKSPGHPNDPKNPPTEAEGQRNDTWFPASYTIFIKFLKCPMKFVTRVMGIGLERITRIEKQKRKYKWAVQIMKLLVEKEQRYNIFFSTGENPEPEDLYTRDLYEKIEAPPPAPPETDNNEDHPSNTAPTKQSPPPSTDERKSDDHKSGLNTELSTKIKETPDTELSTKIKETPLLVASQMGIVEMVKRILKKYPIAIQDKDSDKKNSLLLAAEHRQTEVYNWLIGQKYPRYVYYQVDKQGNNALHLAAMYQNLEVWHNHGSALQMQGERKWYMYVKKTLPRHGVPSNKNGQTPRQIFRQTHETLLKDGTEWLVKTANSCSVVAALIATVAFATAATIPGGPNEKGQPHFEKEPAFNTFSKSSLASLCFSVTSLVFFLAILTSRCQYGDFAKRLPTKLHIGLTSLFASITAILVTFSAAHFFILEDKFKNLAFLIYGATCVPVVFFAFNQLPLYVDLISSYQELPLRGYTKFYTDFSVARSTSSYKNLPLRGCMEFYTDFSVARSTSSYKNLPLRGCMEFYPDSSVASSSDQKEEGLIIARLPTLVSK